MRAGKAEQRLEGSHRGTAAVEPEDVFVEVRLDVLLADAVMGPQKPGFQIAEDMMDARGRMTSNRFGSPCVLGRCR